MPPNAGKNALSYQSTSCYYVIYCYTFKYSILFSPIHGDTTLGAPKPNQSGLAQGSHDQCHDVRYDRQPCHATGRTGGTAATIADGTYPYVLLHVLLHVNILRIITCYVLLHVNILDLIIDNNTLKHVIMNLKVSSDYFSDCFRCWARLQVCTRHGRYYVYYCQ